MASIRKRGNSWQAQIDLKNIRTSKTFKLKAQATAWAASVENAIVAGTYNQVVDKTFGQLLDRYAEEISAKKEGSRWEQIRIGLFQRRYPALMDTKLSVLSAKHLAEMRDHRRKTVSDSTIIRERHILSNAFNIAVKEWKWLAKNPMEEVSRPKEPEPRDRRISKQEIDAIIFATGYSYEEPPTTIAARVGAIFLFAIETAMRCKEMCILRWDYVDFEQRTAIVPKKTVMHTKTGGRAVPLSKEALRILRQMQEVRDGDLVFNLKPAQVDANFRKYRDRVLIEDLHFHDTKHEGITRLAKKLSIYDLARAVGTRNLKTLMGYYNNSAADIAPLLD